MGLGTKSILVSKIIMVFSGISSVMAFSTEKQREFYKPSFLYTNRYNGISGIDNFQKDIRIVDNLQS